MTDNVRMEIDGVRPLSGRAVLRVLDTVFASIGLLIGLPLMAVIGIISYLESGSPLFLQHRVGMNQRPFMLIKFRTMKKGIDSVATHDADPASVTRIGKILRRTKLDEIPQLINVLLGHMSLVGPRPCLFSQIELIEERSSRGVYRVRPGITGLGQINKVDMSTPRKLARYDALMIAKMTTKLYFYCIVATILGKGTGDRVN